MLRRLGAKSPLNLLCQQGASICACNYYRVCALSYDEFSVSFTRRDHPLLATLQGWDYLCNTLLD